MPIDPTLDVGLPQALVRGPSLRLVSSLGLGWRGISVERHRVALGERLETPIAHPVVKLASGQQVAYGERADGRGRLMPFAKEPGSISLHTEGVLPLIQPSTELELTACALDPAFVTEVAAESDDRFVPALRGRMGFRDEAVCRLIRLLEQEASSGGVSGRLYVDHLAHALTLRLFAVGGRSQREPSTVRPLSHPRLRRVVERMQADLSTDLDLATLAAESGYSRNHFLRMFRAATGYTPHRYLLQLQVQRAQALMKNKSMPLGDIALACGFSSHAQLTRAFRKVIGATPSEYRRNI